MGIGTDGLLFGGVLVLLAWLVVDRRTPPPRLVSERGLWRTGSGAWASPRWLPQTIGVVGAVVLGSPLLAVGVPLVVVFARRELKRRRRSVAAERRAEMVVGFVSSAMAGLRAGRSLPGSVLEVGIGSANRVDANPLQADLIERVTAGRPFALAVDEVFGDGSVDERLIATTIGALEETGASASMALERVGEALGERQSSREDARTQAQHALSSAGVLAALPLVFGLAAALAEPDVGRLYVSTWLGAGCVGTAMALIFGSWEWMQRLLGAPR